MANHSLGVELFFADGRTDIRKLIVVFAILQRPLTICIEGSVLTRINVYFISIGRKFISEEGDRNKKWK